MHSPKSLSPSYACIGTQADGFFDRIGRGAPYLIFFAFQLNERKVCMYKTQKRERRTYKASRPKDLKKGNNITNGYLSTNLKQLV
jgi:hypothetical protein